LDVTESVEYLSPSFPEKPLLPEKPEKAEKPEYPEYPEKPEYPLCPDRLKVITVSSLFNMLPLPDR